MHGGRANKKPSHQLPWANRAFSALDRENRGFLYKHEILDHIQKGGVYSHHQLANLISALEAKSSKDPIDFKEFESFISGENFIKRVIENTLIMPMFPTFIKNFERCFNEIKTDKNYNTGNLSPYIPSLLKANPNWFAASFCSADGQFT